MYIYFNDLTTFILHDIIVTLRYFLQYRCHLWMSINSNLKINIHIINIKIQCLNLYSNSYIFEIYIILFYFSSQSCP